MILLALRSVNHCLVISMSIEGSESPPFSIEYTAGSNVLESEGA